MGKVTPQQYSGAIEAIMNRGNAGELEIALSLVSERDDQMPIAVGIEIGMELVRRYGVLALDVANLPGLVPAEHGPAARVVLAEVAHRNGMHVAWITRREFEEFLGQPLTEQQWMELDDTLTEAAAAQVSPYVYVREALKRAGWRAEQISSHELRWVYRPEGWDQS